MQAFVFNYQNGVFVQTFIILFKGVNVGGNNLLPMKKLVADLEKHNFHDVASYIQSGNIVLKSADDPVKKVATIINENYGFTPEIFAMNQAQLSMAVSHNPFTEYEGKLVHFYFCHQPIEINNAKLTQYLDPSETYHIQGNVFYLYAPNGIGRSKLVSNIESCLGQKATGRNLNTMHKICTMVDN